MYDLSTVTLSILILTYDLSTITFSILILTYELSTVTFSILILTILRTFFTQLIKRRSALGGASNRKSRIYFQDRAKILWLIES